MKWLRAVEFESLLIIAFLLISIVGLIIEVEMSTLSTNKYTNIRMIKQLQANSFKGNKILQDLTLAQAILESDLMETRPKAGGTGGSQLATKYQNLFGQKPGKLIPRGTKGVVYLETEEQDKGGRVFRRKEPFLWNESIEDSLQQHEKLFTENERYKNLWQAKSFEEAAKLVRMDGYATDVHYTQLLVNVYNKWIKED